jgi:hypothetical protein
MSSQKEAGIPNEEKYKDIVVGALAVLIGFGHV